MAAAEASEAVGACGAADFHVGWFGADAERDGGLADDAAGAFAVAQPGDLAGEALASAVVLVGREPCGPGSGGAGVVLVVIIALPHRCPDGPMQQRPVTSLQARWTGRARWVVGADAGGRRRASRRRRFGPSGPPRGQQYYRRPGWRFSDR